MEEFANRTAMRSLMDCSKVEAYKTMSPIETLRKAFMAEVNKKVPTMFCGCCGGSNHIASSYCRECRNPFPKAKRMAALKKKTEESEGGAKVFKNAAVSVPRMRTEHGCTVCGKKFSNLSVVRRHMRVHSGIKPYNCNYCNRGFAHNQDKTRHEMTHTGEKPFHCGLCFAGFIRKTALKQHLDLHSQHKIPTFNNATDSAIGRYNGANDEMTTFLYKNEPFACRYCGKAFNRQQNLIHHERVHTGEKPFACRYCNKTFTQEYHVKRHLKTHFADKAHVCELYFCAREFKTNRELETHRKTDHADMTCARCFAKFTRPAAFSKHLEAHAAELGDSSASGRKIGFPF